MKLPRKHMIGEVEVEIVPVDDWDMDDGGTEGMYTVASGEPIIKMKKGLRGNYRHFCQLHEFGHAVIDMAEIHLDADTEERIVGAFASAILRLLKDTRELNKPNLQLCESCATLLSRRKDIMLTRQTGPTARKDKAGNMIFTEEIFKAYSHDLEPPLKDISIGDQFQFFNGPYGSRKFEIVTLVRSGFNDEHPIALTAKAL